MGVRIVDFSGDIMTHKKLWEIFIKKKNIDNCKYEAYSFGMESDLLASLVLCGKKTATSSAYPLYELDNEPFPKVGEYSIILDSKHNAVCIIKTTDVDIVPFNEITAEFAFKEGEGDKSLEYWQNVHRKFFSESMNKAGLSFTMNMKVVCEEFMVVFSNTKVND